MTVSRCPTFFTHRHSFIQTVSVTEGTSRAKHSTSLQSVYHRTCRKSSSHLAQNFDWRWHFLLADLLIFLLLCRSLRYTPTNRTDYCYRMHNTASARDNLQILTLKARRINAAQSSPVIWDHTALPDIWHRSMCPLNPS